MENTKAVIPNHILQIIEQSIEYYEARNVYICTIKTDTGRTSNWGDFNTKEECNAFFTGVKAMSSLLVEEEIDRISKELAE